MMKNQPGFFDEDRLTVEHSIELTVDSLREYGQRYRHWALAFSGGKDSSALATVVPHLIESGRVPAPESLTVLYADTRMELPPLQMSAMGVMAELRRRGIEARVVLPAMDDRFMVYMLGRGVPPPTNRFRWCTAQIKVEPMLAALAELRERADEKLLMLTGVRIGESAVRDARIYASCSRDGGECGQGWFQTSTPDSIADTLAPLLHWRTCLIWDWLMADAPELGFPTREIGGIYGLADDGSEQENSARTGCVGCNLASRDNALETITQDRRWAYLKPLFGLRSLYAELRLPSNRLRKHGENLADGTFVATDRMGPLTLEARRMGLECVLGIQSQINEMSPGLSMPDYSLINAEEQARIEELIAANTWPNRWDGTEDRGDVIRPVRFTRGGGRQFQMMLEAEENTP